MLFITNHQAAATGNHRRRSRLLGLLPGCFVAAILTGCSVLPNWGNSEVPDPPIKEVLAYWDEHVHLIENTQSRGALPGLAGRVWLDGIDPKLKEEARGKIVVQLFDVTAGPMETAKPLVEVTYNRADLPKFKRKDLIGDGYTLFVPWETYREDIKEVKLKAYYIPDKGPTISDPGITITLRPAEQPILSGSQQILPASAVGAPK